MSARGVARHARGAPAVQKPRGRSVKVKLLATFAGFVAAVTVVNAAVTAYLVDRHGEAEARTLLSQELVRLQDELQRAEASLRAVALSAVGDEKNLSDLALLYSQQLALGDNRDPIRLRALELHRTASMNRLQLILMSARLSSLAVYMGGEISHWVVRDTSPATQNRVFRLDHPPDNEMAAGRIRTLVPVGLLGVDRVTVRFDFPSPGLLVLRVIVPVLGTTRVSFDETIAESLTIASPEGLKYADAAGQKPTLIGHFVFSQAFGATFLDAGGAVARAVMTGDARQRVERVPMRVPGTLLNGARDPEMQFQTVRVNDVQYYQALRRWSAGDAPLILGGAISHEVTAAGVRQALAGVFLASALILGLGLTAGYVLISRMVTPVKALTAAAGGLRRDVGEVDWGKADPGRLQAALGRYLTRPVTSLTGDEIGELASAFNALAARLHDVAGELASSEAQLAQAQRLSLTGSFTWNVTAGRAVWSDETYRIYGFDPATQLPPRTAVFERVHPEDAARVREHMDRAEAAGVDWSLDHRLLLPNGVVKYVHVTARASRNDRGELEYVGAVMDVTAHRRAEDALEELAGRLIHAQEEERSRIGRELHDHISQRLGLLTIKLDQQRLSTDAPALRQVFDDLRREASDITTDIHDLSHRLHSSMLEQLGLEPALHRLASEIADRHKLDIDLIVQPLSRSVPPDVALCLFRVVEEALANVAEHSRAAGAQVLVDDDRRGIRVIVEDQGAGFAAKDVRSGAGLGLVSMRERLRLVRGTLVIDSTPGAGTRVEARVPWARGPGATEPTEQGSLATEERS